MDREINDPLRRSASAEAAVCRQSDITSCWNGRWTCAEGYEILCPDPLEDPNTIYVDVKVSLFYGSSSGEQEEVTRELKELGPWVGGDERFITREEGRARVDVDPHFEHYREFFRRISLLSLATIISKAYQNNRKDLVNELFEAPSAITEENSLASLSNRSKFTKEVLEDWFFTLDTYSKCITLVEAFSRNLHLVDAPVKLHIYDIYCKTYTRVNRFVHLNLIDKNNIEIQLRELSVLRDVKLTPVNKVLENFLSFVPDVHFFKINTSDNTSSGIRRSNQDEGVALFGNFFRTLSEPQPPAKKRLKTPERYTVKNGYSSSGESIEPFSIAIRSEAILPTEGSLLRQQLLFPVHSSDSPDDVLFFVKPKKTTVATLFLPGLFRSEGQFLSGDCKNLASQWRYTLADYTPIRGLETKRNDFYASLKTQNSKMPVLRPLYF